MRRILSRRQARQCNQIVPDVLWPNAEGGLKNRQMDDLVLTMGLVFTGIPDKVGITWSTLEFKQVDGFK